MLMNETLGSFFECATFEHGQFYALLMRTKMTSKNNILFTIKFQYIPTP